MSANGTGLLTNAMTDVYSNSPPTPPPPSPYRLTLTSKETELRKLKGELHENKINLSYLESDLKAKDVQLEKKDLNIAKMQKELTRLRNVQQEVESLRQYQEKSLEQENELKKLKAKIKELSSLNTTVQHLEEENFGLINDNDTLKAKIKHLEEQASREFNLSQVVDEQKIKIANLEEELAVKAHLLGETEKMNADRSQHLNQIHSIYQEKIDFLEERIARADVSGEILSEACIEIQVHELQCELAEVKNSKDSTIAELQGEVSKHQRENERLNAELNRNKTDYQLNLQRSAEELKATLDKLIILGVDKNNLEMTFRMEQESYKLIREKQSQTIAEMESTFNLLQIETDELKKKFQDTAKSIQLITKERDDSKQEADRVKNEYEISKNKTKEKIEEMQEKLSNISINKCSIVRHLSLLLEQHKIVKDQMQNQQSEIDKQSTAFEIYLEHLSKNVSILESEKTEYDSSCSQLEQTAAALIATLKKKQDEITTLKTKLHRIQTEKERLTENENHLKNNVSEMAISLESAACKANEREKNLQNILESRLQEIENFKTKGKTLSKEKKDLEKKLQVAIYEKSKISSEIESKRDELETKQTEVRKLTKLRDKAKIECVNLEKIIKEKDEALSQLDQAMTVWVENTKSAVNCLNHQLSSLAEVNFELGSKLISIEETCSNRISQLERVHEEKNEIFKKLQQTSEEAKRETTRSSSEIVQLQRKLATVMRSYKELEVIKDELLTEMRKKETENVSLMNSFTKMSEVLEGVIKKSEYFRDQVEAEVNTLDETLKSTEIRLNSALSDIEHFKERNARLEDTVKDVTSESQQLRTELTSTQRRLKEDENKNSNLVANLVGENETFKKEIIEKTAQINHLESQTREILDSTGIQLNAALEEAERYTAQNKTLGERLIVAEIEISRLKTESLATEEKILEDENKTAEAISILISEKELQREEIEGWMRKAKDITTETNESLKTSEIRLNNLLEEAERVRDTNKNLDEKLKEAKKESSQLKIDLIATQQLLEEIESKHGKMISTLNNMKELKRKETEEWMTKMSKVKEEVNELREDNTSLRQELKKLEDKETKLIIENGRLVREQHSLGMNHELELAEKLDYFRKLWETDKCALELRLDCKSKEIEDLKLSFSERLKQEALKYAILQKEFAVLQAKYAKAEDIIASNAENQQMMEELKQKVDLYRRHYEVHQKKSNELSESLLREKEKASALKTKIDELNNTNQSLQRRFVEFTNNLKLKPFDIYSSTVSLANLSIPSGEDTSKSRTRSTQESIDRDILTSSKLSLKSSDKFDDSLDDFNVSPFPLRSSTKHLAASINTLAEVGGDRFTSEKNWLSSENENILFDNKYLSNLKEGTYDVELGRLSELQRRNTLCQPHLKTSYPIETQMCNAKDEELKKFKRKQSLDSATFVAQAALIKSPPKRQNKNFRSPFRKPGVLSLAKHAQYANHNLPTSRSLIKTPASIKRLFQSRHSFKINSRQSDIPKNTSFNIGFSPKKTVRRRLIKSPSSKLNETRSRQSANKLKIFSNPFGRRDNKNDLFL